MKKTIKRMMALMLSLVMVFGCIPSFINEVSADGISTVADVLDTCTFPTSDLGLITEDSWISSEGNRMFLFGQKLCLNSKSSFVGTSASVTNVEGDYVYQDPVNKYTFRMTAGVLTSVEYYAEGNKLNGTYEPPILKPVAEILATCNFPSLPFGVPNDAWISDNGHVIFLCGNSLCFDDDYNEVISGVDEKKAVKIGAGWLYEGSNGIKFIFKMTGEKLTSIEYLKQSPYEGTYAPAPYYLKIDGVKAGENVSDFKLYVDNTEITAVLYEEDHSTLVTDEKFIMNKTYIIEYSTFEKPELKNLCIIKGDNAGISFESEYIGEECTNSGDHGYAYQLNDTVYEYNGSIKFKVVDTVGKITVSPLTVGTKIKDLTVTYEFGNNDVDDTSLAAVYKCEGDMPPQPIDVEEEIENGLTYYFTFEIAVIEDIENYDSIMFNGVELTEAEYQFYPDYYAVMVGHIVSFNEPTPTSSGSKSYKAKDEDKTAEKISGSGKKGSKRTITPIEGKKVGKVTITDKDGNKIDVTKNEDGTYSFIQPASDVNVEVTYVNREITLNIGSTEASVDGVRESLDVCPVIRNDRTMLPIRFVAENLGAKVEWNEKSPNYVVITRGDTKIEITLGSYKMLVNGKEVKLDSVAFAENDRTYLPVRAVSENLNAIVEWNEAKPMEVKIYER